MAILNGIRKYLRSIKTIRNVEAGGKVVGLGNVILTPTSADMSIYVDGGAGSDTTGSGSVGNPYATITKAYEQVPRYINHKVEIRIKAGTYTAYPRTLQNVTDREGQFIMEGIDPPTIVAGPFTSSGIAGVGTNDKSGVDFTVAAAGWGVDQFYGKFLRLTSGADSGRILPIHRNTADTISTTWVYTLPIVGDTFDIVEPSVKIDLDHGITWAWETNREYVLSSFALANMAFTNDYSDDLGYTPSYSWIENGTALFGLVSFYADVAATFREVWHQAAGSVGNWRMQDPTRMVNINYIMQGAYTVWANAQFLPELIPPTTALDGIFIKGMTGGFGACEFMGGCTRGVVYVYGKCDIKGTAASSYVVDHRGIATLYNARVSCGVINLNGVKADSNTVLIDFWVDDTPLDGINIRDGALVKCLDVDGDTANITGYGIKLGKGCEVLEAGGVTIIGTAGAVRFDETSKTVSHPASGFLSSSANVAAAVENNLASFDVKGYLKDSGALKVGPDGNLVQNNPGWDDIRFPFIGRNIDVASGRISHDYTELGINFADNSRYAATEQISMIAQFSHSYKFESSVTPHLHWVQSSADIPNWLFVYRKYLNGAAVPGGWVEAILASHVHTYTAGTILQLSLFPSIDMTGFDALSGFIDCKLFRDTPNTSTLFPGADPLVGDALAKEFDIHFQQDTPGGSAQELVK